jgi:hypothetical protein
MNIWIRIVVVLILVAAAYVGGLAWRRLCLPLSGVGVTVNGNVQNAAFAQTCPNGLVRVVIPGQNEVLINHERRDVYYLGTEFHDILGLTFTHDPNPVGVSINNRVKIETDPQLEFTESLIAYSDFESHDRIVIRLAP